MKAFDIEPSMTHSVHKRPSHGYTIQYLFISFYRNKPSEVLLYAADLLKNVFAENGPRSFSTHSLSRAKIDFKPS